MLNRNDESGHLPLVHDLREKAFTLSPLNIVLAMGLQHMTFITLRYAPTIPIVLRVSVMIVEFCQKELDFSTKIII